MDRQKKAQLDWFLDFISSDLERLTPAQLQETASYLEEIVLRSDADKVAEPFDLAIIERFQGYLRRFFERIIQKINDIGKREWRPDTEAEFFPQFGLFKATVAIRIRAEIPHELPRQIDESRLVRPKPGAVENALFQLVTKATGHYEETILLRFIQSLEGVHLGALRQCPECSKWFAHLTNKKRDYCSGKCAARKINRDKRAAMKKEDPEAYKAELKKGRERAHP